MKFDLSAQIPTHAFWRVEASGGAKSAAASRAVMEAETTWAVKTTNPRGELRILKACSVHMYSNEP